MTTEHRSSEEPGWRRQLAEMADEGYALLAEHLAERVERTDPGECSWCGSEVTDVAYDPRRYVYASLYRGQWHYSPAYCSPACHIEAMAG